MWTNRQQTCPARQPCRHLHGVQMIQRQRMMTCCHRNHRKHPRHPWSPPWRPFAWGWDCRKWTTTENRAKYMKASINVLQCWLPKPDTVYTCIYHWNEIIIYLKKQASDVSSGHFDNIDQISRLGCGIWVMYPSPWVLQQATTQNERSPPAKHWGNGNAAS